MTGATPARRYLADLLRLPSVPGAEAAIVDRACREMRALGYADVRVDVAGNAVGRLGSGAPTVLVDCHVDTVPVHDRAAWSHDPFGADVADGRMYGLGASDMKGSLAAATHGLARLAGRPAGQGSVVLSCSVAEETMEGAALRGVVEAVRPTLVVVGEPTDLRINHAQRGRAKVDVEVGGRGAHAASPELGVNAVDGMARLLTGIGATRHPGSLAIACLEVASEPRPSVSMVPHRCVARFDCRFGVDVDPWELPAYFDDLAVRSGPPAPWTVSSRLHVARFTTYTDQDFGVSEVAAAWHLEEDEPVVLVALDALARAGITPRLGTYGFCTNGSLTAGELGLPTIGFGPGREQEAHTVDEWIALDDVDAAVNGYASLVEALLAATSTAAAAPAA
jgi:putative selenium metabolism hydrolase